MREYFEIIPVSKKPLGTSGAVVFLTKAEGGYIFANEMNWYTQTWEDVISRMSYTHYIIQPSIISESLHQEEGEKEQEELWNEIGAFTYGSSSFEWYPGKMVELKSKFIITKRV